MHASGKLTVIIYWQSDREVTISPSVSSRSSASCYVSVPPYAQKLCMVQVADVLRDVLDIMRPLADPIAGKTAVAVEKQLHDFYSGDGFLQMQPAGLVRYRKDDVRLIAALDAVRETKKSTGEAATFTPSIPLFLCYNFIFGVYPSVVVITILHLAPNFKPLPSEPYHAHTHHNVCMHILHTHRHPSCHLPPQNSLHPSHAFIPIVHN